MQIDHLSHKLVQLVACLCSEAAMLPQNIKSGYERLIDKRPTHRYLGAPKSCFLSGHLILPAIHLTCPLGTTTVVWWTILYLSCRNSSRRLTLQIITRKILKNSQCVMIFIFHLSKFKTHEPDLWSETNSFTRSASVAFMLPRLIASLDRPLRNSQVGP